jgi:hypothetical protein
MCLFVSLYSLSSRGRGCKLVVPVSEDFILLSATAWKAPRVTD